MLLPGRRNFNLFFTFDVLKNISSSGRQCHRFLGADVDVLNHHHHHRRRRHRHHHHHHQVVLAFYSLTSTDLSKAFVCFEASSMFLSTTSIHLQSVLSLWKFSKNFLSSRLPSFLPSFLPPSFIQSFILSSFFLFSYFLLQSLIFQE